MTCILRALLAALCWSLPLAAFGQGAVLQGGPVAPGRAPMYVGSGPQAIVQDSGPAGGGGIGLGLAEQLLTVRGVGTAPYANAGSGPLGSNWCDYDAPTTNVTGYHFLCLSPNAQGGGLVAYGAAGAASQLPLTFNINGAAFQFPFTTGGIVGPTTTTIGHLALWANTTGTLLSDGGAPITSPGTTAVGDIVLWNGTTGKALGDLPLPGNNTTFLRGDGIFAAPAAANITVGTTPIAGGSANCIVYDLASVFGCIATANNGVLVTNGSGAPSISNTLPGSLLIPSPTFSGTVGGAQTIPGTVLQNNAVGNAQLAQMSAAGFKGNAGAGAANVADLTPSQATATLNAFVGDTGSGGTKGLVPAPSAGSAAAGDFLSASGAFVPITQLISLTAPPYNACTGSDDTVQMKAWLAATKPGGSTPGIAYAPPGTHCIFDGLIGIPGGSVQWLYGVTFTMKAGGSVSTAYFAGDAATGGGAAGPSNVTIYGLTVDGNTANRTGPFQFGNFGAASANDITYVDTRAINCSADCYNSSGSSTFGLSHRLNFERIFAQGGSGTRNLMSFDGVLSSHVHQCWLAGNNAAAVLPDVGIDVEPDSLANLTGDITIDTCNINGKVGGAICVNCANISGGAVLTSQAMNINASGNGSTDYYQFSNTPATKAGFRFINAHGVFGGSLPAVDALP